jgi:hypothetical protein
MPNNKSKKKTTIVAALEAAQFEPIVHRYFQDNDDFIGLMKQMDSMLRFSVSNDEFCCLTSDRRDNFVLRAQRLQNFIGDLFTEHILTIDDYEHRLPTD